MITEQQELLVRKALLDEAVHMGTITAAQANKQMRVNHELIVAIGEALALIKSGRITEARDRLQNAAKAAANIMV
jgi:hypothetical protein